MPRGRPKKTSAVTKTTVKVKKTGKTTKATVKKQVANKTPPVYDPFLFEHTGVVKANPRNLFEEWGLQDYNKDESKIDKKLYKNKKKASPRRPPVTMIKVDCPICNRKTEILETLINDFEWTIPNETNRPTFKCDKCLGI